MTEIDIITRWLQDPHNAANISTLSYTEEIYNFIVSTHSMISNSNGNFFKLEQFWYRIVKTS
jgi:hypothetical protein